MLGEIGHVFVSLKFGEAVMLVIVSGPFPAFVKVTI